MLELTCASIRTRFVLKPAGYLLWQLIQVLTFWSTSLTILSYSHGDVDFQVRACTYIHMDGIGFLVTGRKTEHGGERASERAEKSYMLSNY